MKKILKIIMKNFLFVGIFVLILIFTSKLFEPKNNTDKAGMNNPIINGYLSEKDNTIDLLFLGDSEVYSSIMPLMIWEENGISSFLGAKSAEKLSFTLSFLNKFLYKHKPKIIMLETNCIFRKTSPGDFISTKMMDQFPIFEFHNRWKKLTLRDLDFSKKYTFIHKSRGYFKKDKISKSDDSKYMNFDKGKETIPFFNKYYVEEIYKTCKENNIELILYSTPSTKNWNYKKHNTIEELSKELNIEYLDLNTKEHDVGIDWKKDSYDKGDHLNIFGATKTTKYISKYLKENKKIKNKKDNPKYKKWDEALLIK